MSTIPDEVQTQNASGNWVPSIPLPYFMRGKKVRCGNCPQAFKDAETYRGHYALVHILELS